MGWTDLESFRATCEHRRPGRVLYAGSFTEDLRKRVVEHIGTEDIGKHYGFFGCGGVGLRRPAELPALDYSMYWEGQELPAGTKINGMGVAEVPSGFYHFWGYISPLREAKDLSEIENYPLEDYGRWDASQMTGEVAAAHAAGCVTNSWVGHTYEVAWQIRGYEQFLMDMIERPAWAECLLQRLAEQNLVRATAAARAGVDYILCGDDVANQRAMTFSVDMWREMIHSRWQKVWAATKAINPSTRIWYHSDGNVSDIVPELIEAGVDILNPLQPECLDLDAIHRRYGRRLVFDGCIGTQSTMPWGKPAEVRARVKELIEKYGRDGGLMLSPTHVLEPEVPLANIDALFEACREYGTFSK